MNISKLQHVLEDLILLFRIILTLNPKTKL